MSLGIKSELFVNILKKICLFLIVLILMFHVPCEANSKKVVNVLTRCEYLRIPQIASIVRRECGVEISYDEYYYPNECLRRFVSTIGGLHSYDIIIFPSVLYESFKEIIRTNDSTLNVVAKKYGRDIREHYLSHGYPSNIVYFALSLSGFIWNPANIKISMNDSIFSMFKKAKKNIVILIHNYPGIWVLFNNKKKESPGSFEKIYRETIQNASVYITDGRKLRLYDRDEFSFAYERANEAALVAKGLKNNRLNFFVHPKYSYIIPDLLAVLNTEAKTQCVAKVLASKKILDIIQKEIYYLSPYGTYKSVDDPMFQNIYRSILDNTYILQWADPFFATSAAEYSDIRHAVYKINLLPRVNKIYSK